MQNTDHPFNFYIITFGDSLWRERKKKNKKQKKKTKPPLKARTQFFNTIFKNPDIYIYIYINIKPKSKV